MDAKLLFILSQQTPMIHFQWDEDRAILRAADVKPKLDSFIYDWVKTKRNGDSVKEEWKISNDHKALNYKMKFVIPQGTKQKKGYPQFPNRDIYFGNMGKDIKPKKAVFYEGDIELQIICFYADLREILIECMETFFLIHNFGTRQNRGLGSFILTRIEKSDGSVIQQSTLKNVEKMLQSWYATKPFYKIDYSQEEDVTADKILYDGNVIYKILKSGINDGSRVYKHVDGEIIMYLSKRQDMKDRPQNIYIKSFLTVFFLKKTNPIAGEKRFMKVKGLAPKRSKKITKRITREFIEDEQLLPNGQYRYIRALLGVTDNVKFIDDLVEIKPGYEVPKKVYRNKKELLV